MNAVTLSRAPTLTGALRALVVGAFTALARRGRERRAAAQLHALSDRQLADIGLARGQIEAVVRGLPESRS